MTCLLGIIIHFGGWTDPIKKVIVEEELKFFCETSLHTNVRISVGFTLIRQDSFRPAGAQKKRDIPTCFGPKFKNIGEEHDMYRDKKKEGYIERGEGDKDNRVWK